MKTNFMSGFRQIVKTIAFTAFGNGPLLRRRLNGLSRAGKTTILNLHRVAPNDGSDYRPLDPGLFDDLLSFVKHEFAVVTFGELREKTTRPKLVLSFDDGYKDFVINAMPILSRHGLRANQNIIPRCVESGLPPLNVIAQDFIGKAPRQLVERLQINGFHEPIGVNFGWKLSRFLKMKPQAEQDQIARYLVPQFYNWDKFEPTPMMTLEEVRNLGQHEIGAHSFAHSSMEFETDEYLDADVRSCATFFKERLASHMSIYAFPNGSCRAGQAEKVLAHGVDHVLLVGEKFDEGKCIHNRFTFDGRSRSEIKFKTLGGITPL
jgi:peptidoglycan/xylan/chitin deacetylase (PgdA/CDA1 family)